MFHTLSDASSSESSTEGETCALQGVDSSAKAKGKTTMVEEASTSSDDEYHRSPLEEQHK